MNADDLKDLYSSLRGSRSALAILDAQTLFTEKQMVKALVKLKEAHVTYQESRARLLKQDPEQQYDSNSKDGEKQARRLKRKQEKAREILDVFDDLVGQLEKLARRERARQPKETPLDETAPPAAAAKESKPKAKKPEPEKKPTPEPVAEIEMDGPFQSSGENEVRFDIARPTSISERFLDEFQENWGDDQLDVVGRRYSFTAVLSDEDIHFNALYFLRNGDDSLVVHTSEVEGDDDITLVNVISKKPLRPLPRDAFVKLGLQRKMVLLLDRESVVSSDQTTEAGE